MLADVEQVLLPGLAHWQHPKFFGYFPSNGELSTVLGDYLSTGLGVLGITWESAPALTEHEERVARRDSGHCVVELARRAHLRPPPTPLTPARSGLSPEALDRHTLTWLERLHASGSAWLTPAQLEGRWMVRISIGSIPTERPHLTQLLTDLQLAVR